jgi:hypothetical protein
MDAKTYCVKYGKDYRGIKYTILSYGDEHEDGHTYTHQFHNSDDLNLLIEELESDGFISLNEI